MASMNPIDPQLAQRPHLVRLMRADLLETLRRRHTRMTESELAAATGYRVDWVRAVLTLLAAEGLIEDARHPIIPEHFPGDGISYPAYIISVWLP